MSEDGLRRPTIFLASSSEGLDVAKKLERKLRGDMSVTLWRDAFPAGEYTLKTLQELHRFDGAIVLATKDDKVVSRGKSYDSMRDNLLVEYGISVASFGYQRALLVIEDLPDVKVPSDLHGLTLIGLPSGDKDGLGKAARKIRDVVCNWPNEVISDSTRIGLTGVLAAFHWQLGEALGTDDSGFHLWLVDERHSPPRLVRVARSRSHPKTLRNREFAKREGIVGECWERGSTVTVDFSENPYRSATEQDWRELGDSVRRGMTYEDLSASRSRYRAIGAVPVVRGIDRGSQFVGCLSYNVGSGAIFGGHTDAAERILDQTSEIVRVFLESTKSI